MNVLAILIPVSLTLGLFGLVAFIWAIRTRQFDDPVGQASRVLLGSEGNDTKIDAPDDQVS